MENKNLPLKLNEKIFEKKKFVVKNFSFNKPNKYHLNLEQDISDIRKYIEKK